MSDHEDGPGALAATRPEEKKAEPAVRQPLFDGAKESPKEVSAATVGRMLGLATATDLKLLDGKLDLLSSKFVNFSVRIEKALALLNNIPNSTDLERIDAQIMALHNVILETHGGGHAKSVDLQNRPAAPSIQASKPKIQTSAKKPPEGEKPAPAEGVDKAGSAGSGQEG